MNSELVEGILFRSGDMIFILVISLIGYVNLERLNFVFLWILVLLFIKWDGWRRIWFWKFIWKWVNFLFRGMFLRKLIFIIDKSEVDLYEVVKGV